MPTDHMHCMDAKQLLKWLLRDLKKGSALGIPKKLFFTPQATDPFTIERYGKILETPLGVAAGPHTQMTQNILAAWLCGARYIELKTVQILDTITVTKPCIAMEDEGYNCEWSQELTLEASFNEYIKAVVITYILHDYLGFEGKPGVSFNMSAGYSMEGILSPTMQKFFAKMESCPEEMAALKKELAPIYPRVMELDIPDYVSRDLTISCMHGCPPDEVEKIALYFINRNLNTTLKLNATLLGPDHVRSLVNDAMGYSVVIPDIAFEHDLSYESTLEILKKCLVEAKNKGVTFGVKLTNTLETENSTASLPGSEKMVYMSGKPLHPIAVALASKLHKDFGSALDITFCAGADAINIADTISCNLVPVTVCSDLLKPGGYTRLAQFIANIRKAMSESKADSLSSFISKKAGKECQEEAVGVNLESYAASLAVKGSRYSRSAACAKGIKTPRALPVIDCAEAPCTTACPAGQNIPAYIEHVANGSLDASLAVILTTNPLPSVLGRVCNQNCKNFCTRVNYDEPLQIRAIKSCAASEGNTKLTPSPANGRSVAIVGSGPEALSCAYFLALSGCKVSVVESTDTVGGMLARLAKEKDNVTKDIKSIVSLGVDIATSSDTSNSAIEKLLLSNDAVYVTEKGCEGVTSTEKLVVLSSALKEGRSLSIVEGVGEGRRAAHEIFSELRILPLVPTEPSRVAGEIDSICQKQAFRVFSSLGKAESVNEVVSEAKRCLQCDKYCGICVSVCPNRANVALPSVARSLPVQEAVGNGDNVTVRTLFVRDVVQPVQIVNIGDFCNECGNCGYFCPSSGIPFRDKQRVHLSETSFKADNRGILHTGGEKFVGKNNGIEWTMQKENGCWEYKDSRVSATLDSKTLVAKKVTLASKEQQVSLAEVAQRAVFCELLLQGTLVES